MKRLIACLFALACSAPAQVRIPGPGGKAAGSGGTTFTHYRTITLASSIANYAAYLVFDSANSGTTLETAGSGGHVQNTVTQSGGSGSLEPADAVFSGTAPGGSSGAYTCPTSTYVPWDTIYYSASGAAAGGQQSGYWLVRVLANSTATLYLCYGAAAIATQQNASANSAAPAATYANSQVLYLPFGSSAALSILDDTGTSTQTNHGSATAAAAEVGGGISFSGGSSLSAGTASGTGTLSMEFWVNLASNSSTQAIAVFSPGTNTDGTVVYLQPFVFIADTHGSVTGSLQSSTISASTWYHVAVLKTAGSINTFYLNNVSQTTTGTNFVNTATPGNYIGIFSDGTSIPCSCTIDEFRVYNTTLSSAWIAADYANEESGSTFVTVGSEN